MSRNGHLLRVTIPQEVQQQADAGWCVFPEHTDQHEYEIVCPASPCPDGGWMECSQEHICEHGCDAREGFEENDPDGKECPGFKKKLPGLPGEPDEYSLNCWDGEEDFEFHGVEHTYRYGHGWTVPFEGCIVIELAYELPEGFDEVPIGDHAIETDWIGEESVYLEVMKPDAG